MITPGRLCIKIAGRDAGQHCVVLTEPANNRVLIDGATRRRQCNIAHLEPLSTTIEIKPEASHQEVIDKLTKLNITSRKTKPKKASMRPRTLRRSKLAKPTEKTTTKAIKPATRPAKIQPEPAAQPPTQTPNTTQKLTAPNKPSVKKA